MNGQIIRYYLPANIISWGAPYLLIINHIQLSDNTGVYREDLNSAPINCKLFFTLTEIKTYLIQFSERWKKTC